MPGPAMSGHDSTPRGIDQPRAARPPGSAPPSTVHRIAPGLWLIDLHFSGLPGVVAAYLLADESGRRDDLALIETGPASTVEALWAGIEATGHDPRLLRQILVTH